MKQAIVKLEDVNRLVRRVGVHAGRGKENAAAFLERELFIVVLRHIATNSQSLEDAKSLAESALLSLDNDFRRPSVEQVIANMVEQ